MSKKTLIILLAVIVIGVLVIIFAGRGVDSPEPVTVEDDDAILDLEDLDYEPVVDEEPIVDEEVMEEEPVENDLIEDDLLEE